LENPKLGYEDILTALRLKREQIEEAILTIERLSAGERGAAAKRTASFSSQAAVRSSIPTAAPKKRTISAAGRKRIAEAMRKRWAAKRVAQKATEKARGGRKAAKKRG
jgi:hypothetical protein